MKFRLEEKIEELNNEIKKTKDLLKLFLNGQEYFNQKIKKLKTEQNNTEFECLNEESLKLKLVELSDQVKTLKQSKPMLTIYNDGNEEKFKLNTSDVQNFILSSLDISSSSKCFGLIKNVNKLDRVSIFIIEDERLSKLLDSKVSSMFDHTIIFDHEEGWMQNLLRVNLIKNKFNLPIASDLKEPDENTDKKLFGKKTSNSSTPLKSKNKKYSRKDLILSFKQLIKEKYPLPIMKNEIKKTTKLNYKPVTENSPMFAIDCEMCKTENGNLDVTRVSIVNEQLIVLLDEYVKPNRRIVDYLTEYSGITKNHLENVTTTIEDIHAKLDEILPEDSILVGHSLNCDLRSLGLCHPYIIDTSCIYNFTSYSNCKPSLKRLSEFYLNHPIQNDSKGHCSIEDAMAAMKLVQLKLAKSIAFGDNSCINKKIKPILTLSEFLELNQKNDVKIMYNYLDLDTFKKFVSVISIHYNKVIDKVSWALSLPESICILVVKGKCFINLNT